VQICNQDSPDAFIVCPIAHHVQWIHSS